jgi:HK97 family phage major capsid protein
MPISNRAYSLLEIKSFDEEQRLIRGIATTPQTDLQDDIVEPRGATFKLPIPFLFAHDSRQPLGHVQKAEVTDAGIEVEVKLIKVPEPGKLKDRLDEAWQSIKYGLIKGLSIGFKDEESEPIKGSAGRRITRWSWLELSAVVVAANQAASITAIKEIDSHYRAASGNADAQSNDPAASGHKAKPAGVTASRSITLETRPMPMTNADRMKGLEEKRAAEMAALEAVQNKITEENRTKDEAEQETFDGHAATIKSIDRELSDCRLIERELIAKAKPPVFNPDTGAVEMHTPVIQVAAPKLEPGIAMIKQLACVLHADKYHRDVFAVAREHCNQWPQIEQSLRQKAAVAVGTTTHATFAAPLVYAQNLVAEFVNLLWPMSVMGRIAGLRRVPFNSRIPRETSVIAAEWVGEGRAKPVGALAFDTVSLTFAKCALIIGLTDELARFSSPSAEMVARDTLAEGITKFIDEQFLSANAAVTNVSPAGILNGADTDTASGTDSTAVIHDIRQILSHYQVNNIPTDNLAIIMQPVLATAVASIYTTLGVPQFPNLTGNGGSLLGLQVITSNNVPSGYIISMHPPSVAIADEGGLQIDASREASVELEDNPTSGNYHLISAFQSNLIFVRAERFITWARLRSKGVFYLTSAAYGGAVT